MVVGYLGIPHEYGKSDCITLCKDFYQKELNIFFDLPTYSFSKNWMNQYSIEEFDLHIDKYAVKINLTSAKNYDLMVFKSLKSNLLIHFGIFIAPIKLLHVEYGNTSKIETLSEYWIDRLYGVYRPNQLV